MICSSNVPNLEKLNNKRLKSYCEKNWEIYELFKAKLQTEILKQNAYDGVIRKKYLVIYEM